MTVPIRWDVVKVGVESCFIVFVHGVAVRPGIVESGAPLALKGRPNEGGLTGKGV
jgi:hypothetical protein